MSGRILIIDSEPAEREALEDELASLGYEIARAEAVDLALRARAADEHERDRAAATRPIVAASPGMIACLETLERFAAGRAPVLLEGEAGTGRESLARALHAQSPRRVGPFVAADARGPDGLGCDEVGEGPGALPLAHGGTLYLEAVEGLSPAEQETLLCLLREGTAPLHGEEKPRVLDVRVVAAATAPLEPLVRSGAFSEQLLAELAPGRLPVPALRERREDLPLLVDHFLADACTRLGRSRLAVGADALARLVAHPWPGNLRELEAALLIGALRTHEGPLSVRELPDEIARQARPGSDATALALRPARKEFESDWIRRALRLAGGNRTRAARLLEISHRALLYKLKEFGITD